MHKSFKDIEYNAYHFDSLSGKQVAEIDAGGIKQLSGNVDKFLAFVMHADFSKSELINGKAAQQLQWIT